MLRVVLKGKSVKIRLQVLSRDRFMSYPDTPLEVREEPTVFTIIRCICDEDTVFLYVSLYKLSLRFRREVFHHFYLNFAVFPDRYHYWSLILLHFIYPTHTAYVFSTYFNYIPQSFFILGHDLPDFTQDTIGAFIGNTKLSFYLFSRNTASSV